MELPFLTLQKYDGRKLKPFTTNTLRGGGHAYSWVEGVKDDDFSVVFKKVRNILKEKGETLDNIARLQYDDMKGFDNRIYRIDGSQQKYFLKILGDEKGNRREIFVWKVLGYGDNGRRAGSDWIPGLPAEVYAMDQLNSVLLPYYPGQLKAVPGGSYEFPMVVALVLFLNETLAKMHKLGMMFMDLCPENILYISRGDDKPVSFFLADMGSVKLIAERAGSGADWDELGSVITRQRLTRSETRPPDEMFPQPENGNAERDPGYDFHTLARTALVLLGLSKGLEPDNAKTELLTESFSLESPLTPRRAEMNAFFEILSVVLKGEPVPKDRLYDLYKNFYLERAAFAGRTFDDSKLKDGWLRCLTHRVNRYKMVLSRADRKDFERELLAAGGGPSEPGLKAGLQALHALPRKIIDGDYQGAVSDLAAISGTAILNISRTAAYSYDYHRKVLKGLARGNASIADLPNQDGEAGPVRIFQIPEKATLDALRRKRDPGLGLLTRPIFDSDPHFGEAT